MRCWHASPPHSIRPFIQVWKPTGPEMTVKSKKLLSWLLHLLVFTSSSLLIGHHLPSRTRWMFICMEIVFALAVLEALCPQSASGSLASLCTVIMMWKSCTFPEYCWWITETEIHKHGFTGHMNTIRRPTAAELHSLTALGGFEWFFRVLTLSSKRKSRRSAVNVSLGFTSDELGCDWIETDV